MAPLDLRRRPLKNLRLSVTDRCNLRCNYCMPEESYQWMPRPELLSFEELARVTDVFLGLGVEKVRLTGGEPLLRRNLPRLIRSLAAKGGLRDLALTTNGLLLGDMAGPLKAAGLHRITVSLDTLRPDRFREHTRRDDLARVLGGIQAALDEGLPLKLDTVALRGTNDDELEALLEFAKERGAELRYIEYMDVGGATNWSMDKVISRDEILRRLTRRFGPIEPVRETSSAPATRYRLRDGTVFGIIASTTAPFCATCDRCRVTADGHLFLCLYAKEGLDLRALVRGGATDDEIAQVISGAWAARDNAGAEERLALRERAPLAARRELEANPRLEMHKRGG
ncbi:MAG TPA: GTP 3',8-cyclase MoaA [Planctomycetes bacterium]|nr:GTP 3',8-cyclase MoaA [Planctomycetota bacterium]